MSSSTEYKARSINLKAAYYGTFAEIGAGQEVARYFFQAGHASATVAKTMSAYDKQVSDSIYGKTGRFVSRDRLIKMLAHEYDLLHKRLHDRGDKKLFFAFANTVTTSGAGHCWSGLRFQLQPHAEPCDILLHLYMHDTSRLEQHEALGVLGVNLIYACFEQHFSATQFVQTLGENLRPGRVDIDAIEVHGEALHKISDVGLELVAQRLSRAMMFVPSTQAPQTQAPQTQQAATPLVAKQQVNLPSPVAVGEVLYDKSLLIQRGTFRPINNTHVQVLKKGEQHLRKIEGEAGASVLEMSVHQYLSSNKSIDGPDLKRRVQVLTALGYYVLVSNYASYAQLRQYLRTFTTKAIAFVVGADKLERVLNSDDLLTWMLDLFDSQTKFLVYPYKTDKVCQLAKTFNLKKPLNNLYQYFLDSGHIVDIAGCDDVDLSIRSSHVRELMQAGDLSWHKMVPAEVVQAPPFCKQT